jgi:hypothetical protein
MSQSQSGSQAHNTTVNAAEGVRQVAIAAASTQAAANAAEIVMQRACLASALLNGIQPGVYITALKSLGTGGS